MAIIIIFWACVMAIIFFVVGTFFKALASCLEGAITAIEQIIVVGLIMVVGMVGLYLLYAIIHGILNGGLMDVIAYVIELIITICIIFALFGMIGEIIIGIIMVCVQCLISVTAIILEKMAWIFEKGYVSSINLIFKYVEKC